MSKFVTYPAVTVLDDDQSLLIDSPSAGTNSITAENAGNTLLSKWAGFDTFDEAVQNTISNNQEFIDRDAAIRSETADLKRKIVTTFPAKDASGQIATFDSEFEDAPLKTCIVQVEPVQDLHGYDSPWPAGGGKNLFNEEYTSSQLTYVPVFVGDGTYTLSTSMPRARDGTTNLFLLAGNVSSGASSAGNGASEGHPRTVESVDGYVTVVYRNALGVDPASYETQLESGSTATSYVPYENICPISGWTGVEVQRTGFNVWDEEWEVGGINDTTGEPNVSVNTQFRSKNYIPCSPNTDYFAYYNAGANGGVYVYCYDVNKSFLGRVIRKSSSAYNVANETFTTTERTAYMLLKCQTGYTPATNNKTVSINYPSTNHDYHPYSANTYPITFPSEAGTVYGGYVDVTGGELVVDRAMVVVDGVNKKVNRNGTTSTASHAIFYDATDKAFGKDNIISDRFTVSEKRSPGVMIGRPSSVGVEFLLPPDVQNNTTALNQWFADNPTQLCYELAEPIHYPLTPQEIKTLLGTNNIWANTGGISVGYLMSDVGWYVEKKLRAFQSILAGVEDSEVASKNYSTDSYLIFNDDIYRVTKTITAGETIEDGVNMTKTTVAEQLMALTQA